MNENVMKVFACQRSGGKGLVVCSARSKAEAYGAMVMADDCLKFSYNPDDFYELVGVFCEGDAPAMLAEGGND